MTRQYKLAILKGDGIGPEVVSSATRVLEAAAARNNLAIELIELPIGLEAYKVTGRTFPPSTVDALKETDGWILGPLQAGSYPKDDKDYPMASGKIRKLFDLFANIRPFKSYPGVPLAVAEGVDFVIVRENTEDFYPDRNLFKGYGEFWTDQDTVVSLRVITRRASARIARVAFDLARSRQGKKTVTAVHKANVLVEGDGLFLEEVRRSKLEYTDVKLEETLVDSLAMKLVQDPGRYDVILTTNLFGDILSDEAAGLIGGLGLAPSLNAGERYGMAQSVHGSAPDIAGKNIANPTAEILSVSMLLDWLYSKHGDVSLLETARRMKQTIGEQLANPDPRCRTPDLGGNASTNDFTDALLERITINRKA